MGARQTEHSISIMARVLGLSKIVYYAWLGREPSRRAVAELALGEAVQRIHTAWRGTCGSPRVRRPACAAKGSMSAGSGSRA